MVFVRSPVTEHWLVRCSDSHLWTDTNARRNTYGFVLKFMRYMALLKQENVSDGKSIPKNSVKEIIPVEKVATPYGDAGLQTSFT